MPIKPAPRKPSKKTRANQLSRAAEAATAAASHADTLPHGGRSPGSHAVYEPHRIAKEAHSDAAGAHGAAGNDAKEKYHTDMYYKHDYAGANRGDGEYPIKLDKDEYRKWLPKQGESKEGIDFAALREELASSLDETTDEMTDCLDALHACLGS